MSRRLDTLQAFLNEKGKRCKLDDWTAFTEEMKVPGEIMPALMTGRPELLAMALPRHMSAEEVGVLFKIIKVLLETNAALREHASDLANSVDHWGQAFRQLESVGQQIVRFGQFQPMVPDDD
jgi:hypothetical protein